MKQAISIILMRTSERSKTSRAGVLWRFSEKDTADDNKDIHDDIKCILETSSISTEEYQEAELLKNELFGEKDTASDQNEAVIDIRYSIDDAYQGNEAVEMVRRARESGNPYSMVFMDVRMPPGMDGIETIEDIWKIDPDIGVVICTAYSDYSWNQIVTKLGQNDNLLFIRKPFDHVSLKQIALAMTTKWSLKMQVKRTSKPRKPGGTEDQ